MKITPKRLFELRLLVSLLLALFAAGQVLAEEELPIDKDEFHPRLALGEVPGLGDGRWVIALGDRARITLFVEEGRLRNGIWFHEGGRPRNNTYLRWLFEVENGRLEGRVRQIGASWSYHLEGRVGADGALAGNWTWQASQDEEPQHRGALRAKLQPWAAVRGTTAPLNGEGWPRWTGPLRDYSTSPQGHDLVDDLADMTPLWRSEANLPSGLGNLSRSAKGRGNSDKPLGGGAAQPILVDERLYLITFHPDLPDGDTLTSSVIRDEYEAAGVFDFYRDTWGERVGAIMEEFERRRWSFTAHDRVLCIDARTGETLWETRLPGGANWQDHKGGFNNHTPLYHDGRLYVLGSLRQVLCLDAADGQLLWATPPDVGLQDSLNDQLASGEPGRPFFSTDRESFSAPELVDGVLIIPYRQGRLEARDAATGSLLWTQSGLADRVPGIWRHRGETFLLATARSKHSLVCLDLAGEERWRLDSPNGGEFRNHGATVEGDRFAATSLKAEGGNVAAVLVIGTLRPDGATVDHAVDLSGSKALNKKNYARPIIRDDTVTCSFNKPGSTVIVSMNTGRVLARAKDVHTKQNGHIQRHEDRLLVLGDNHHGDNDMQWTGALPETLVSAPRMSPPHVTSSPYSGAPWIQTYADGRLFIRGGDGIYAYDLRDRDAPGFANRTPEPSIAIERVPGEPASIAADAGASDDPDGDNLAYAWDFGDGHDATGVAARHTYANPGTHLVTLTVTDARGRSAHTRREVRVGRADGNNPPIVAVSASTREGPAPLSVTFDASASIDLDGDPLAVTWRFADGTTSTGKTIGKTFTRTGQRRVELVVADGRGGKTVKTLVTRVRAPEVSRRPAWSEDFTDGGDSTRWELTGTGTTVEDGGVTFRDGHGTWTSEAIDVSRLQRPAVEVVLRAATPGAMEEEDWSSVRTGLDGAEPKLVEKMRGAFNGGRPYRVARIHEPGETLRIQVDMSNSSKQERYRLLGVTVYDAR